MSKLFHLVSDFEPAGDQPLAIKHLLTGFGQGLAHQTLLGVTGSGKTYTMAQLIAQSGRPSLILAPNKTLAAQLYGEMKDFFPNNAVEYFVSYYDYYQPEAYVPSSDTFIQKDASINEHIEQMRLSATKAIMERKDAIIVATVSAIYGLGDPDAYFKMVIHLVEGDSINREQLLKRLVELQYTRNDTELRRGTFRVAGDVIDVFPADSDQLAIRIELFDEDIEGLAYFDPLTAEVIRQVKRLTIYPKTHYVTPRETLVSMIDSIKDELRLRLEALRDNQKLVEAQRLEERTRFDIEMILELGYCTGIENYSRYLSGRETGQPPPTLMEYLPHNALLMIDESHVTVPQIRGMHKGDRSRKQTLVDYGFRLPSALDNRPLCFEEFEKLAPQTLYISATPSQYELTHSDQIAEQLVRPTGLIDPQIIIKPAHNQVDDLLSEIHACVADGDRVLVTTLTKRMSENLSDYLQDHQVRVRYLHSDIETVERVEIIRGLRLGEFDVLVGINLLREGLDMPEVSLVAILDADKEGFLRSESALIQTIGRAARHIRGRAILYADKETKSMQRAIAETNRRREKQQAHNIKHHITPQSVKKAVKDIMDTAYGQGSVRSKLFHADKQSDLLSFRSEKEYHDHVKRLEEKMLTHAKNLEFEQAATLRDELKRIQEDYLSSC